MVGIVGSAGGIDALFELLGGLPPQFPVPVVIAQHLARGHSNLAALLGWRTGLEVKWLEEGHRPAPGVIYIIRPGQAAAISSSGFRTSYLSPARSSWLASADLLLNSIAAQYRSGAVGIILSGMLPAGVEGIRSIRAGGGTIMAQSRRSSAYEDMPTAATDFGKADIVMAPCRLAKALVALHSCQ